MTEHPDPQRLICAVTECRNELAVDRRHVANLRDAGWRCLDHREETV